MTLTDRIRMLASALPSDASAVTLTRADLVRLLAEAPTDAPVAEAGDLSVEEVARELKRATSTVRGWLIAGALRGYKLNGRDWRVPRPALRDYLDRQADPQDAPGPQDEVDIGAWRRERREAS